MSWVGVSCGCRALCMQDRYGVSSSEDLGISDISGCFGSATMFPPLVGCVRGMFVPRGTLNIAVLGRSEAFCLYMP